MYPRTVPVELYSVAHLLEEYDTGWLAAEKLEAHLDPSWTQTPPRENVRFQNCWRRRSDWSVRADDFRAFPLPSPALSQMLSQFHFGPYYNARPGEDAMGILDSIRKAFNRNKDPQKVTKAVTEVMIVGSWDELLAVFVKYTSELRDSSAQDVVESFLHAFQDDAYTSNLIRERARIIALCRTQGISAVLQHPPVRLKEPTSNLRGIARLFNANTGEEAVGAIEDFIRLAR